MFAILFEVLLIEIQEEIHHFAGWEGGGVMGTKIMNKNFVNKLAFPKAGFLGDQGLNSPIARREPRGRLILNLRRADSSLCLRGFRIWARLRGRN